MLFSLLYDFNADKLERITEEERMKLISMGSKIEESYFMYGYKVEFYRVKIDGVYYLIDDKNQQRFSESKRR